MLPEYEEYFRSQLQQFAVLTPTGVSLASPVVTLIPQDWRADARFFLLVNLYAMIVGPFRSVQQLPLETSDEDAAEMIQSDIETVVKRAREVALRRGRAYVSGTSVAIALGEVVAELKTTSLRIWGPG